jgi:hypothetical protein
VALNVYPSEDFDFVDSVQLPDLILDLVCIHCENTLINTLLGGYRGFLRRAGSVATAVVYTLVPVNVGWDDILVNPCARLSSGAFSFSRMISITSANAF